MTKFHPRYDTQILYRNEQYQNVMTTINTNVMATIKTTFKSYSQACQEKLEIKERVLTTSSCSWFQETQTDRHIHTRTYVTD